MARPKLTVYVDVVSPFAYMAYYLTRHAKAFKQCDITYIPFFLGGVMKATGNRTPLEIKNKDKWIDLDRRRWAKAFNIPISATTPQPFPQSSIKTQRTLCAIQLSHPDKLATALDALYQAFWVETQTIDKVYADVLKKALGEEVANQVVEAGQGAEAKGQLQKNSDAAVAEGAFGAPWFVAENAKGQKESFWGFDHMGLLLEHLGIDKGSDREFRSLM